MVPKVGMAIILIKDGKVLLGKRKGSHGDGDWSFPGGHLEFFEGFKDCLLRELKEETGLIAEFIDNNPVYVTNDFFKDENKHYITLFMRAKYVSGEPENKEPDKCEGWEWFEWSSLPDNLFLPIKNLIKQGFNPLNLS